MRSAPLALAAILATGIPAIAVSAPRGPASPLTDPAAIEKLAADAYAWAVAPEFVYRFSKYNALHTAPINMLGGKGSLAAAWNNLATNAGDASVLYLNSMMDLSGRPVAGTPNGGTKELVLTVPPSKNAYYVVNLLDSFINSTGSVGTRTTPSTARQTYLITGPTSKYANKRTVRINGATFRVMPNDTNLAWMLIRIRADSLVPSNSSASTAVAYRKTVKRFALNTLKQYQENANRPIYPATTSYPPSAAQQRRAQKWKNAPTSAVAFFAQAGRSLVASPMPARNVGLGGTPMRLLPSWVVPQANARSVFLNPSYGQKRTLRLYAPLGLTAAGYRIPRNWGQAQMDALQAGYQKGIATVVALQSAIGAGPSSNFWTFLNNDIGTYPNNLLGYLFRATVVQAGGSANVPLDAVYAQINNTDGTPATQLTGDNTYSVTFSPEWAAGQPLPANGTIPPTVNDALGNPRGFWSMHVYQTDPSQSAAPYITQASALNLAYSSSNQRVRAVNASTDTITVGRASWGGAPQASTPIFFGEGAAGYGLQPNATYYVATTPTVAGTGAKVTYTFKVASTWKQTISPSVPSGQAGGGVPEQGPDGTPGPIADVVQGSGALQWGPVQPVSQLGSQQITSGRLAKNPDGSVTIWFGPSLPAGAAATNWIPTPSTAYLTKVYGQALPTPQLRPLIRIYYPTPGSNSAASILPPPNGATTSTWVPPLVTRVP
jgi:hypothetical protein